MCACMLCLAPQCTFIGQIAGHLGHIKALISVFLQPVTGYDADEMARHKFRNLRKLHPLQQQMKDLDLIDEMLWYEAQIAVDGDRTRPTLSALYLKNLEAMVSFLIPFTYVHIYKIRAVMQICLWSSSWDSFTLLRRRLAPSLRVSTMVSTSIAPFPIPIYACCPSTSPLSQWSFGEAWAERLVLPWTLRQTADISSLCYT